MKTELGRVLGVALSVLAGVILAAVPVSASVSQPSVTLDDYSISTAAEYTIKFDAYFPLGATDTITIDFPSATTLPTANIKANVTVQKGGGTGITLTSAAASNTTKKLVITFGATLSTAAEHVEVIIAAAAGIKNPSTSGDYTLKVKTSLETTYVESKAYTISGYAPAPPPAPVQQIEFTTPSGPSAACYTNYLSSGTVIFGYVECTGEYQPIDWSYNWDFQILGPGDEVLHSWTGHWVNSPRHNFDFTTPYAGEYKIRVSHQSSYSKHIVIAITPTGWELGGGPPPAPAPTPLSVNFDGWYVDGAKVTTATTDDTVTARITLSGGDSGQYRMRIRRDIIWATDETVAQLAFAYDGASATREISFNPPYATDEASTDGYHVDLLKDGYTVWTLVNAYPPRLRVKTPPNQPPVAHIDSISPSSAKQGEPISFSGHGVDPDGSVVGFSWRSNIDGQLSTSSSFSTSRLSVGTHTIYFKVRDNDGLWSEEVSRGLTIKPPNRPPTAYIDSISSSQIKVGEKISFTGHGSDPDGTVVGYNWRSSIDSQLSTSSSFTTSNLSEGTHIVYFKVKDDNDAWSEEVTGTVIVERNKPPVAYIDSISPSRVKVTEEVLFAGYGNDPDGSVVGYNWRSSIDGQLSTASSFTTSSLSKGTHTVYFKVKDDNGAWSDEVSSTVVVKQNRPPVAYIDSISPDRVKVGSEVSFSGHGTDPDGSVVAYSWRSSIDGQLGSSSPFTTSNLSEGTHTIYFKVRDDNEIWSEEVTGTVIVEPNRPPVAYIDFISPSRVDQPEQVSFKGHGTDPDGSVVGFSWRSSLDGQLSSSSSFTTSGLSVGKHTIYFKVRDNDRLWSGEVTSTLIVDQPGPYVELYGQRTDVKVGEEVILNLSVVNPITSPGTLVVQLTLSIPSGWSITSSGFGHGAGGLRTNTYEVEQGPNPRTIDVHILANEPYDGVVTGYIDYYFAKEEEYKYHKEVPPLPVTAAIPEAPVKETPESKKGGGFLSCSAPAQGASPPSGGELLLGWMPIALCWVSLGECYVILRWRRRNQPCNRR